MTFKCSNGGLQWLLPEVHKIWTMYYLIFMFWLITQSVTDWYVKWFGASQSPKQAGRNQKMADLQERQLENRDRKQVLGGAELLFEIYHFHCAKKTWTPMTRDHVIEVIMTRNKLLKNSVTGNVIASGTDTDWHSSFIRYPVTIPVYQVKQSSLSVYIHKPDVWTLIFTLQSSAQVWKQPTALRLDYVHNNPW